ncbi:MAG: tRNA threonylcarbamoyladenosine dehydratase [Candidatus Methanomethylophilaceae archaeon]|nr:tRNA threonylcarbamoyladenosine dehydratase [Candidatus Methanomethylophilaceae archaeon]
MSDGLDTRTGILIGEEGVEMLRSASVIVCGCGAVGGYSIEGLVRAGVGRMRVVDGDVFSGSNLNRQVLATTETIGRPKAQVACERARSINPDIDIECMECLVSEETLPMIFDGDFDILVDAIDTVGHKAELLRYACSKGIRTFSSMGAALHMDTQKVRVAPIMKTHTCPLAANLRKRLRDCDTSRLTAVFSEEPPLVVPKDRDDHGKSVLGSLPTVPAVFGMTLANLAIMSIVGRIQ